MTNATIDDIQAWPVLVSDVDTQGASAAGASAGGSLNAVVNRSIREILGWRPRRTDPKGLLAALNQSFSLKTAEGRETWTWTPHSYHVQADAGAVTGAQASLYKMARVAWEQSEPLLDGLTALCEEKCKPEVEAIRAIISSEFSELVSEFGYVGGPRVQRVETLFTSLVGSSTGNTDPRDVEGHMHDLETALRLKRKYVNTIEDEQNLTNYLILVGYALSLRQSWESMAPYLDRMGTKRPFLGTQTTLLNWELAALGESAQQLRYLLESMFVGDGERKTITLDLSGGPLTIEEVAHWAEYVATEEGPRLIREGGQTGIGALEPTLLQLGEVLVEASDISRSPSDNPLPQVHSARAQRAFLELKNHVYQAWKLANDLNPEHPEIPDDHYPLMAQLVRDKKAAPSARQDVAQSMQDAQTLRESLERTQKVVDSLHMRALTAQERARSTKNVRDAQQAQMLQDLHDLALQAYGANATAWLQASQAAQKARTARQMRARGSSV